LEPFNQNNITPVSCDVVVVVPALHSSHHYSCRNLYDIERALLLISTTGKSFEQFSALLNYHSEGLITLNSVFVDEKECCSRCLNFIASPYDGNKNFERITAALKAALKNLNYIIRQQ